MLNSLAPGRCGSHFKNVISKPILLIDILSTSCEIALMRMPQSYCWQISIDFLNGLAPSDNQPMLSQVYVVIWSTFGRSRISLRFHERNCWCLDLSFTGVCFREWACSAPNFSEISPGMSSAKYQRFVQAENCEIIHKITGAFTVLTPLWPPWTTTTLLATLRIQLSMWRGRH